MKKFKDIRSFFQNSETSKTCDDKTVDVTKLSTAAQFEPSTGSTKGSCLNEKKEVESTKIVEHWSPTSSAVEVDVTGFSRSFSENADNYDDLGTLQVEPSQPLIDFPRTKFGTKLRSFSSKYYAIITAGWNTAKEKTESTVLCADTLVRKVYEISMKNL